jgi:tetratricopeptide (TPR) repeat protein
VPPTIVDFSPDISSPQPNGASITWIANARDTDNDPVEYKFQLKGPSTRNSWEDKQDWSERNSWIWNVIELDIGNNTLRVLIRDNKHVLSDIGDDNEESDIYIITKSFLDWYNEANDLYSLGKFDEAIKAYDNVIEINSQYEDAWFYKGYAFYNLRKFDEAIQAFNKITNSEMPAEEEVPSIYVLDTQLEEKLEENRQIRQKKLYLAWYLKGDALRYQEKYYEAVQAYDEAIRLDPANTAAWISKGNSLHEVEMYNEAVQAYDKAIELDPDDTSTWISKGDALYIQGEYEYDDAIRAYDEAIKLDPDNDYAWEKKGNALYEEEMYDEAVQAYDKAIELDPDDTSTWINKGNALYIQGEYNDSIRCYDKAIKLDPDSDYAKTCRDLALTFVP